MQDGGREKRDKVSFFWSNIGAARKGFPHWLQKTITHCLSLFSIFFTERLEYQTNWPLELGELLLMTTDFCPRVYYCSNEYIHSSDKL